MTPAIDLAIRMKVVHTIHPYQHEPGADSYGLEAAEKLALDPALVFKTLVLTLDDGSFCVAILPVKSMLSMKLAAKAAGAKKATMADKGDVERVTGYVLGGVSPLGQKKRLPTLIDGSATAFKTIYISAGKRGLEIELAPQDLHKLVSGLFAPITA
ncbi:MAG: Cys-tRNA(Pro)/Cys-tRNA(Cys) deacylase [Paraglaciecola sp.]|jgi:Cys-tRNA(Pro)/Cys-tRNA(Cys) deacylase